MSDGKYRWITAEECAKELDDDEYVWLSTSHGITPGIYDKDNQLFRAPYGRHLDLKYPGASWRICRAMVPEAPEVVSPPGLMPPSYGSS